MSRRRPSRPAKGAPARLLTYADVAERLQLSERSVRRLADAGALSVIRIGRAVRIDPRDLERFLAGQRD
ncbi:MAG: helix-turn-helix domain-containing protein [Dongiaceae bacterium]